MIIILVLIHGSVNEYKQIHIFNVSVFFSIIIIILVIVKKIDFFLNLYIIIVLEKGT